MRSNPVLRRELLARWRGRRATIALTVYLGILGAAVYGLYALARSVLRNTGGMGAGALAGPAIGRFLLESLMFFTLVLVLFVVPAYAAAQIAGERERRTLPLLQATLLAPWEIVAGKLGASTAWLALLVVSTAPLAAATMFLGGVTVPDVLRGVVSILVTMIGIGCVALGISSLARRTATAVVLTYAFVMLLVAGSSMAALTSAIVTATSGNDVERPPIALYANPFYGLADAVHATMPEGTDALPSPLSLIAAILPDSPVFGPDEGPGAVLAPAPDQDGGSGTWLWVAGFYTLLGAGGFTLAARRLRVSSERLPRRARRRARGTAGAGAHP